MKKIVFLIYLLCFALLVHAQINPNVKPEASEYRTTSVASFTSFKTDKGIEVFLINKSDYPKFRISFEFQVPFIDDEQEPEVKDVLSEIMSAGNKLHKSKEISSFSDAYDATVIFSMHTLSVAGLKEYLPKIFPLAAEYLIAPDINEQTVSDAVEKCVKKFTADKSSKNKKSQKNFMAYLRDSLAFAKLTKVSTKKKERSVDGYRAVTVKSVKHYFNNYINPQNTSCIITGDFTKKEINGMFSQYLKKWKSGPAHVNKSDDNYITTYPKERKIFVVDKPGAVQSNVMVSWPLGDVYPYSEKEPLFIVMNQIFGESYLSNLNKNIRLDKGLSYGANNILNIDVTGGSCTSRTMVRTQQTSYALENILFEMLRMRNELPSKEQFEMAINGICGDYSRSMSQLNSPKIIGFGMVRKQYNLPDNYLMTYLDKIMKVTPEDIRKLSQQYIDPFKCNIYIEGNVEKLRGTLEKFGPVVYYSEKGEILK